MKMVRYKDEENKDGEENYERMREDGNYEQESRYKNVTVKPGSHLS